MDKMTKSQRANMNRKHYKDWKKTSLESFGYYPIFQPFKETFLLRTLSGNALKLYVYLGLMSGNTTGESWVTIATMAKYFEKSERTISGWLKELEQAKLIERFQLKPNSVAHTFLNPYGFDSINDENSLQKRKKTEE